jgi:hypothetical protein
MSSETWKKEVTAVRGEYSARLKRALHTNGNESSSLGSYPTPTSRDWKGKQANEYKDERGEENTVKFSSLPGVVDKMEKNWATPNTMDHLPPKTGEALARNKKKGGCKNLREDVNNPNMNWATPQASDHVEGARTATESNQKCLGRDLARLDGPQDQVSNSTSGSNQGSWPSPTTQDISSRGPNSKQTGLDNIFKKKPELKIVESDPVPKLNPAWVCQLMGLPSGWTNLGCWATE